MAVANVVRRIPSLALRELRPLVADLLRIAKHDDYRLWRYALAGQAEKLDRPGSHRPWNADSFKAPQPPGTLSSRGGFRRGLSRGFDGSVKPRDAG